MTISTEQLRRLRRQIAFASIVYPVPWVILGDYISAALVAGGLWLCYCVGHILHQRGPDAGPILQVPWRSNPPPADCGEE